MKLSNNDIMDYLDGALDPKREALIEEHLRGNTEDASLIAEMKEARALLQDWDQTEPVALSADFWPKLRDKLPPEGPQRSALRGFGASLGAWLWPSHSRAGLSVRVAVVAAIMAMAAFFAAPRHDVQPVIANDDASFIRRSIERHADYLSAPPVVKSKGDTRSLESADDDDDEGRTP